MSLFSDIFGGNSDYQKAAQAEQQGLQQGYSQATPLIQQGRGAITSYDAAALAPYTSLLNNSTAGAAAYGDATGANGAAGYARATNNFQAGPGYQSQFNQGLQAIDRGAAAKGMVTSGNTLNAEQAFGTGLANQSYQQYVANLQPYLGQQTAAAAGVAGVNQNEGSQLNASYGNQGNLAYNTQVGIGNVQGASDLAQANADSSFLNGALNLGGKLLGYASSLGARSNG
jgi:hypothetical protein